MKRFAILLLCVGLLLSACREYDIIEKDEKHPLLGTWKRVGDNYSGGIINVELLPGNKYHGVIVEVGGLEKLGFEKGETKWQDIDALYWDGDDLGKNKGALAGTYRKWRSSWLLSPDQNSVSVVELNDDGTLSNRSQTWVRVTK